jgi:undecaprenyl-diphosphatase
MVLSSLGQVEKAQPQSLFDWLMVFCAQYLYLGLIGLAVVVVAYQLFTGSTKSRDLIHLGLATLFIFALSYLLTKLSGQLINDPRPFMTPGEGSFPLIPSSTDNGFPSDHTLLSTAVAAVVLTRFRSWGIVLFLGAVLVGLARVYCRVHHLLDIVGSLVIVAIVFVLFQILAQGWRQYHHKKSYRH